MSECHATNLNRRLPAFDHTTAVALAEMGLALGRPGRALRQLADVAAHGLGTADPLMRIQARPAFAEASARAGQRDQAATAAANFENWFTAAGSTPNLALLARIRALLAPAGADDDNFEQALRCTPHPAGRSTGRGRSCSTGSRYAVGASDSKLGSTCASRTNCSSGSAQTRGPNAPGLSCGPAARRLGAATQGAHSSSPPRAPGRPHRRCRRH